MEERVRDLRELVDVLEAESDHDRAHVHKACEAGQAEAEALLLRAVVLRDVVARM